MKEDPNVVDFNKLKHLREAKALTQDQVADHLGLSRPSYALIEQGLKDITVKQLYVLTALLNISVSDVSSDLHGKDQINYPKFKELILACIKFGADNDGKITKTKLAKLVYLTDFNWYYHYKRSMTGAVYRCIARGPVADDYFRALDEMSEDAIIAIESIRSAMMISVVERLVSSQLHQTEMELISNICNKWRGRPTSEIVNFTHRQNPWRSSDLGKTIPYELILSEPQSNLY